MTARKLSSQASEATDRLQTMFSGADGGGSFMHWRCLVEDNHPPALADAMDKMFQQLNGLLRICGAYPLGGDNDCP